MGTRKIEKKGLLAVEKKALSDVEVEKLYGVPTGTLRNWRCQKRGPRFFKVGSRCYYKPSDVERFLFSSPVLTRDARE